MSSISEKIKKSNALADICIAAKKAGKKVVFTNGCFDILHAAHVSYLESARALGDYLVVAINSDSSVRRLKGEQRPINQETDRASVLAALQSVDFVTVFDEDTPADIISKLLPEILVKGGDWPVENIVGRETVEKNGGRVLTIPYIDSKSTSNVIETILRKYNRVP